MVPQGMCSQLTLPLGWWSGKQDWLSSSLFERMVIPLLSSDYLPRAEPRGEVRDRVANCGTPRYCRNTPYPSCVGGYLAPVAVAFEKRVKALITLGGFYSLAEFEYPLPPILNLQTDMKISAVEWPVRIKDFTMDGIIGKINCPTLVVNGSADKVMPISQTYKNQSTHNQHPNILIAKV